MLCLFDKLAEEGVMLVCIYFLFPLGTYTCICKQKKVLYLYVENFISNYLTSNYCLLVHFKQFLNDGFVVTVNHGYWQQFILVSNEI